MTAANPAPLRRPGLTTDGAPFFRPDLHGGIVRGAAEMPPWLRPEGTNIMPVLQGKAKSPRTEMFWQSRNSRAARVGWDKWVEAPGCAGVFDFDEDPGETKDLAREKSELLAHVRGRWEAWRREMDAEEPRGPFRD